MAITIHRKGCSSHSKRLSLCNAGINHRLALIFHFFSSYKTKGRFFRRFLFLYILRFNISLANFPGSDKSIIKYYNVVMYKRLKVR